MTSLRAHEGWMMIDNRNNSGVGDEQILKLDLPLGAGRGFKEFATYTCSHCNYVVVIEEKRTRERGFCRGCNQRICDPCVALKAQTLTCKTMSQVVEEALESVATQGSLSDSILENSRIVLK
jgi:hypothetical protein